MICRLKKIIKELRLIIGKESLDHMLGMDLPRNAKKIKIRRKENKRKEKEKGKKKLVAPPKVQSPDK